MLLMCLFNFFIIISGFFGAQERPETENETELRRKHVR